MILLYPRIILMKGDENMKSYNTLCIAGMKIHIGVNSVSEIKNIIDSYEYQNIMIITDSGVVKNHLLDYLLPILDDTNAAYQIYSDTMPNPPIEQVSDVVSLLTQNKSDLIIAIGGGSVIDLAKSANLIKTNSGEFYDYIHTAEKQQVAVKPLIPLISIPTTSGTGSEVTQYAVITDTEKACKLTIASPALVSREVCLEPRMTLTLPKSITVSTSIDALAHAMEAFTSNRVIHAPGSVVISDTIALKAIDMILANLPLAIQNGQDMEARKNLMLASTMAGLVTQAGSGAAHGLSHSLTTHFNIPHGDAIGALLYEVIRFNAEKVTWRYETIGNSCDSIRHLYEAPVTIDGFLAFIKAFLHSIDIKPLRHYINRVEELNLIYEDALHDKCTQINARALTLTDVKNIYLSSY